MIKGNFKRLTSADNPAVESVPPGWFAVSHRWIDGKGERRKLHGRWFRIASESGSCFRVLKMVASLRGTKGAAEGDICLDWGAWLNLDGYAENTSGELPLRISPATWLDMPAIAMSHPDPGYRISAKLALLSVLLGLLSLGIALL